MAWAFLAFALLAGLSQCGWASAAPASTQPAPTLTAGLSQLSLLVEDVLKAKVLIILSQLAVLLAAAKLGGWLIEKIGIPGVVGEVLAGVVVGPYLLGSLIPVPIHAHEGLKLVSLFPMPAAGEWAISEVTWTVGQLASIVLLFMAGLETDFKQFMRYLGPAFLIAMAGVIVPMGLGAACVYFPAFQHLVEAHPAKPLFVTALFVGSVQAATSVGITARVLDDIKKLDSPEGVSIIGAAVIDDVLGIIVLAIVTGIAATGQVSASAVAVVSIKSLAFWGALTLGAILVAKPFARAIERVHYSGAVVGLALAAALVASALAETMGLAFIIGAYSLGLGMSRSHIKEKLIPQFHGIGAVLIPIFFAALGTLVDFRAMTSSGSVVVFGLVVTACAILGKVVGCGLASFPAGFNSRGAWRIGLGMLPRGEVALIVASIGLSSGIIGEVVFGVAIMMTLVTTVLAPILLVPAFKKGGSGLRHEPKVDLPG